LTYFLYGEKGNLLFIDVRDKKMPTVVFDFDSTLISCESLEKILEKKLDDQPDKTDKIRRITKEGIRGKIPFSESLAQRLKIAAPSRQDAIEFGKEAYRWLTKGVEELILSLKAQGVDIWVVSGGIQESLVPLGKKLQLPEGHIQGVKLLWDEEGKFLGIDDADPFSRSKLEGVRKLAKNWSAPKIVVGDTMSDYLLYQEGIVEHFILFTQHFRCQEVLDKGAQEAQNISQLEQIIQRMLKNHANR